MRPLKILLSILVFLALPACSTYSSGTKFDDSYVTSIKRGVTTKKEIRNNIGEPASVTSTSEGDVWTYQYTDGGSYKNMVGSAFGLTSQQINMQLLTIHFSGEKVKDFTHTVQKAQ
jgi:outer membrane protein assembly factor BamE (lipoprotein component of BamABCDE complex)